MLDRTKMSSEYGLDGCGMANIKEMAIASCFMENLKISFAECP